MAKKDHLAEAKVSNKKTEIKNHDKKERQIKDNTEVDKSRQNAAGFYDGMPGVWVDSKGFRRIFEIALTPDADVECRLGAHPVQIRACLLSVMHGNAMTRQTILTAASAFKKEHKKKLRYEKLRKMGFSILMYLSFGLFRGKAKDPFKPEPPKEQTSKLSDQEYQERVSELEDEDNESMKIVE